MSRLKTITVGVEQKKGIDASYKKGKNPLLTLVFQVIQVNPENKKALAWIKRPQDGGKLTVVSLDEDTLLKLESQFQIPLEPSNPFVSGERIIGISKHGFPIIESVWMVLEEKNRVCVLSQWNSTDNTLATV